MDLRTILVCSVLGAGVLGQIGCSAGTSVSRMINGAAAAPAICVARPGTMRLAFATDRTLVKRRDGSLWFGAGRADSLRFGLAEVRFKVVRMTGDLPEITLAKIDRIGSAGQVLRAFGSDRKPVLIFVHGFGENFSTSVERAAQVVRDGCLDVVPIVFSWPTTRPIIDYGYDRDSATFARDDLALLLDDLARATSGRKLDLFAHSMGNRVTLEALRILASKQQKRRILDQIVLASPDEDVDVFRRDLPSLLALANRVMVFSAPRDIALAASKFIAGNVPRVGDARRSDLANHGLVGTPRLQFFDGTATCNPFVHRCMEVSSRGLSILRLFLPTKPEPASD